MTDWDTGTPDKSGIYDVTLILFRVPGKPVRFVTRAAWDKNTRKWEIDPEILSDGHVIAWTEPREPYTGPV